MADKKLQIQSVIYGNEKSSLCKAIENIDNALRVAKKDGGEINEAILVYGDASKEPVFNDEEVKSIKQKYEERIDFRYIFFNENTGTAKGHNRMAQNCECEYIMVMNPDIIVSPKFFIEIIKPFKDKKVGMTEGRQVPFEHPKEYDISTGETGWSTTACVVFRNEVFKKVNGFDSDTFFLYCDDLDFSWRVRKEGYKLIFVPTAMAFHAKRLSSGGKWQPTNAEIYYSAEAALFMAYKWSNNERVDYLLKCFRKSGVSAHIKACDEFEKRRKENRLPVQIDEKHEIATFLGDFYSENRFVM